MTPSSPMPDELRAFAARRLAPIVQANREQREQEADEQPETRAAS